LTPFVFLDQVKQELDPAQQANEKKGSTERFP
jgi:hypothetical protein